MCFCRSLLKRIPFAGALFLTTAALTAQDYSAPAGYYSLAENFIGDDLRIRLHSIIDNNVNQTYDAMRNAPRVLDVDPENPNNIILIYSGFSVPGHLFNSAWNREHTWPQSYGADASLKPGADFHHLFPSNPGVNSTRSNLPFDYSDSGANQVNNAPGSTYDNNSFEPRDEDKGRIARAMLYMDLRYDASDGFGDFKLAESANQASKQMAKLSTLLEWNRLFPPDARELRRNHLIYSGFNFSTIKYNQGNRNPFVDFPDLGEAIFTSNDRIGFGTWRWAHFSVDQLSNENVVGDNEDPDGDYIPNLVEYSANFDPTMPDNSPVFTQFGFPGFGTQIRYTQQVLANQSGVTYALQRSFTPLRAETWTTLTQEDYSSYSIADTGDTQLVTAVVPASEESPYFRLAITRETSKDAYTTAMYDPIRSPSDNSDSIFVYQKKINNSEYKLSPWMGYVIDDNYPYTYHLEHRWVYIQAERDDDVWVYDTQIGWFFTTSTNYPYIYSAQIHEWVFFLEGTFAPDRWFYTQSAGWVEEENLLTPAIN